MLLTAKSPAACVTVKLPAGRSRKTSSPALGTLPVFQLLPRSQEPLASTFQNTLANSSRRSSCSNASRRLRERRKRLERFSCGCGGIAAVVEVVEALGGGEAVEGLAEESP